MVPLVVIAGIQHVMFYIYGYKAGLQENYLCVPVARVKTSRFPDYCFLNIESNMES